jgi:RHS repeat-associated protein
MPGGDGFVDNGDFSAFIVSFFADKPRMARNELSSIGLLSSVSTRQSGALNGLDWRHGFAGYLYDTHLGVYHVRARTYDPRLGRWLQRDPIGYAGGWNLYEYTNGDPLSFVDPFGLFSESASATCNSAPKPSPQSASRDKDGLPELGPRTGVGSGRGLVDRNDPNARRLHGNSNTDRARQAETEAHIKRRTNDMMADYVTAAATSGIVVVGLFVPGPEEVLVAGAVQAARGAARAGGTAVSRVPKPHPSGSVWSKPPLERGKAIEKSLGQNLTGNNPVIDRWDSKSGTATSIKSKDLNCPTHLEPDKLEKSLTKDVDKLANWTGQNHDKVRIESKEITAKELVVAIPDVEPSKDQERVMRKVVKYAGGRGVGVKFVRVK